MRERRRARGFALQILYQVEISQEGMEEVLTRFWENHTEEPGVRSFCEGLVRGTLQNQETIDKELAEVAEHWDTARMASVDRNILRFAVYELFCLEEIPAAVTINEAIEIAKKYSTAESGRFVNGILDKVSQRLRERKKSATTRDAG